MKTLKSISFICVLFTFAACNDDDDKDQATDAGVNLPNSQDCATDKCANFEFDTLTFKISGGDLSSVSVNGKPLEKLNGGQKQGETYVVVEREGVRFSHIFADMGSFSDELRVNAIGRDNYDSLRTKLGGDITKLPTVKEMSENGYVYVCDPGSKDPLNPFMANRSLCIDYDYASNEDVPEYLGGSLSSVGQLRWKMVETIEEAHHLEELGLDEPVYGVIEIDPKIEEPTK